MKRSNENDRDRAWQSLVTLVMDGRWDWRRKMSEATGLPFSRVRALDRLSYGPLTLRVLAQVIGTDAPAATVIVNDLEARGLATRKQDSHDKRAKAVSLTTKGRRVLRAAHAVRNQAPAAFGVLTEKDAADLMRIVERLRP